MEGNIFDEWGPPHLHELSTIVSKCILDSKYSSTTLSFILFKFPCYVGNINGQTILILSVKKVALDLASDGIFDSGQSNMCFTSGPKLLLINCR